MEEKIRSVITGVGCALPKRRVSNADLSAEILNCGGDRSDDAWVESQTGIQTRYFAGPGETASTLGAAAARAALDQAGRSVRDVDEIIAASTTPDKKTPSTANIIHGLLGCRQDIASNDLNCACTGFVQALRYADFVVRDEGKRVLVVGTEVLSSISNPADRKIRVLLGDGAGAVVLEPRWGTDGILSFIVGTDSEGQDAIHIPAGGSALPATTVGLDPALLYMAMDGGKVFRFATRVLVEMVETLCDRHSIAPSDLTLLVPHQANWRIIEFAARKLSFPLEKLSATVRRFGNTGTASIPIALADATAERRLRPGDLVGLFGFGAGLTWAGCLIRWGK